MPFYFKIKTNILRGFYPYTGRAQVEPSEKQGEVFLFNFYHSLHSCDKKRGGPARKRGEGEGLSPVVFFGGGWKPLAPARA